MSTTDTRAAFETYILKSNVAYDEPRLLLERNSTGEYATVRIQGAWLGWQAATEAAKAAAPASQDSAPAELPLLPAPTIEGTVYHKEHKICYSAFVHFTAEQMREYGRQCARLGRHHA